MISKNELARVIDHTLLKPEATRDDIMRVCREAREYNFFSVCVNPFYVPLAAEHLVGSGVVVCTVIGFPLGATSANTKVFEAGEALSGGAGEIDMVINVGALKAKDDEIVLRDIEAVVNAARTAQPQALVKVIIETSLLTQEEKVRACKLAGQAGAHFVKTSTGFSSGGATVEDVVLMRQTVGPHLGVKASGGIKTARQAIKLLQAGASRIGASAGVAMLMEL